MKGVIGVGLLLLGFTVGYLVLAGKLPTSGNLVGPSSSTSGNTTSTASLPTTGKPYVDINQQPISPGGIGSGPTGTMGLPTMRHLHDVNSSLGGMS